MASLLHGRREMGSTGRDKYNYHDHLNLFFSGSKIGRKKDRNSKEVQKKAFLLDRKETEFYSGSGYSRDKHKKRLPKG